MQGTYETNFTSLHWDAFTRKSIENRYTKPDIWVRHSSGKTKHKSRPIKCSIHYPNKGRKWKFNRTSPRSKKKGKKERKTERKKENKERKKDRSRNRDQERTKEMKR